MRRLCLAVTHKWSGLNNLSGGYWGRDAWIFRPKDRGDQLKQQGQECPEMGEDLSDIMAAGAENREDCVPDATFQRASGKAPVHLHVSDLGFDGAAPFQELGQ